MICNSYDQLSHKEKVQLIGELLHVVQSSDAALRSAVKIIDFGKKNGLLDGIEIFPEPVKYGENEIVIENG